MSKGIHCEQPCPPPALMPMGRLRPPVDPRLDTRIVMLDIWDSTCGKAHFSELFGLGSSKSRLTGHGEDDDDDDDDDVVDDDDDDSVCLEVPRLTPQCSGAYRTTWKRYMAL
eukprot:6398536-Amphidinium_carterae.1